MGQNMLKFGLILMLASSPLTSVQSIPLRTNVHVCVVDSSSKHPCGPALIQAVLAVVPLAAKLSSTDQKPSEDPLKLVRSADTNAPSTIRTTPNNPLALVHEGVLIVEGQSLHLQTSMSSQVLTFFVFFSLICRHQPVRRGIFPSMCIVSSPPSSRSSESTCIPRTVTPTSMMHAPRARVS